MTCRLGVCTNAQEPDLTPFSRFCARGIVRCFTFALFRGSSPGLVVQYLSWVLINQRLGLLQPVSAFIILRLTFRLGFFCSRMQGMSFRCLLLEGQAERYGCQKAKQSPAAPRQAVGVRLKG